ncbi:hypothetical protein LTR53_000136 [Teratosphaeriaceae sp. CCFEE 6253]|nr:hypothetical protein LTR53_000136 [Teratosphaeriaceae sp. CCFEE 6253]
MNEGLFERFGRSRRTVRPSGEEAEIWIRPPQLNLKVRQYFQDAKKPVEGGSWLDRPEIPTSGEILDTDAATTSSGSSDIVEIVPNKPVGAWESKESYLGAHYELLREDALQALRIAVARLRVTLDGNEESFNGSIGIYEKVHICAVTCSIRGIALRVTFSLGRVGNKIRWDQSKRLISGGLVVLTPANDMFTTKAIVATVAARPLELLESNPPGIDLFIARPEEMELDPAMEWVMVEDRSGFFEADRHTLLALQKMMREPFPLSEHLVDVQTKVHAPSYVKEQPKYDLTSSLRDNKHQTYENVDVLKAWPAQPSSDMDTSQLAALHRMLTKRLAVIQGPPGTGKTYVSEQAVKIMLANRKDDDPPIIFACQTNHAVDQLLRRIMEFEPEVVRLGGRSKDKEIIKRTLYEVKKLTFEEQLAGSLKGNARRRMRDLEKELAVLLSPLQPEKAPLDFRMLQKLELLTVMQADSLEAGASRWVQDKRSGTSDARSSPFNIWLGKALISVPPKQQPEEFGFDFEEQDLAFEHLRELEAENMAKDDDDFERLNGLHLPLADNFTCRKVTGITEANIMDALKEQDLSKTPEPLRGPMYRHLQSELKMKLLAGFREKTKRFNEQATNRRIGQWEHDENILKQQKVIGMTTTGFSKYRGLLTALQPKIILIEEAAELLEAPVTVACIPSLQHLILVGDHKQLRPHCHVKAHEDKPYYLNVSLFERLVNNGVDFDTLSKQHRMIPEIRRILYPIYEDLIDDHASVLDPEKRPNVLGMGGVNSFFFTHQWSELRDDQMSAYNPEEAAMIVGFVEYLVANGTPAQDVTVLTFYNGQRKRIFSQVKEKQRTGSLANGIPTIVTVDSYQGEENEVVILSLTRSNGNDQIGFLAIDNRVCVALSRAKCGFYIFGNGMLLYEHKTSNTWRKVIDIMAGQKRKSERPKIAPISRLGDALPVRCSNHNKRSLISCPSDWMEKTSAGGCDRPCEQRMPCGHQCVLTCHPFEHDTIICGQSCGKGLPCGHGICEGACGEVCACKVCSKARQTTAPPQGLLEYGPSDGTAVSGQSSEKSWASFARNEPMRYAAEVDRYSQPSSRRTSSSPEKPLLRSSPVKTAQPQGLLLDVTVEETGQKLGMLSFGDRGGVGTASSDGRGLVGRSEGAGTIAPGSFGGMKGVKVKKGSRAREESLLD